ncbi:MAG: hypothetical protein WBE97_07215 [Candidatus Acidiferrales bacterium]
MTHRQQLFPVLRWVGLIWLAVWIPVNAKNYGWANFLHECDVAVILTVIGLWYSNALLLSSQAIGILIPDFLWCVDAAWRVTLGHHLIGGTEYMWDTQFPLAVRLMSLFHVALPILLIYAVARVGYDRRGVWLQLGIFAVLLAASRFTPPALNINFAFLDPILHRWWGPEPLHFAIIMAGAVVAFFPVHWAFLRLMPAGEFRFQENEFSATQKPGQR